MQKLTIVSGLLKSSGAESAGAFLAYVFNLKAGIEVCSTALRVLQREGHAPITLHRPSGRDERPVQHVSAKGVGLNAGEDIVLVAACSLAVEKGRRPVAVNLLAGLRSTREIEPWLSVLRMSA